MASDYASRLGGARSSLAFKAPCRVATTVNLTLYGEQTIDGVAVVAGDRVLVKNQTLSYENGIYVCKATAWIRDKDFDGSDDVVKGTRVYVHSGTVGGGSYLITSADPITIGQSSIVFESVNQLDYSTSFLQTGTSAIARTWQSKNEERLSVLDFIDQSLHASILAGSNTTDLTTYIQAAITAAGNAFRNVYFPPGTYLISGALTVPATVALFGDSKFNTTIKTSSATANIFYVNTGGVTVRGMTLKASVTRSAGSYIYFDTSAHSGLVQDVYLDSPFVGITFDGGGFGKMLHVDIYETVADTGNSIIVKNNGAVSMYRVVCDASAAPFSHVLVNSTAEILMDQCDFIRAKNNLYLAPGLNDAIITLRATNTLFDTAAINCICMAPTSNGKILAIDFVQCWGSTAGTSGVQMDASGSTLIDGVQFIGWQGVNNAAYGIRATGPNIKNLIVQNSILTGNTTAAIKFDSVDGGAIQNNHIGSYSTNLANGTGIILAGTTDYVDVRGNLRLSTNSTAITNTSSGTNNTVALLQPPSFRAHKNGTDQTGIAHVTDTKITFGTEASDIGSCFDNATNHRWTPPAGTVEIQATVLYAVSNGVSYLRIKKNGTTLVQKYSAAADSFNQHEISLGVIDRANGTDYYELWASISTGTTGTVSGLAKDTFFSGAWIGP